MAREIDKNELVSLVMEVVSEVEKDLKKVQAKEVTPDEYADTLEKPIDWEAKLALKPSVSGKEMLETLKLKEAKAIRIAKQLRAQREALTEAMKKEAMIAENKRLRKAIERAKASR
jgi:hypothetical protein